jgi:phage tail sheath protein FI
MAFQVSPGVEVKEIDLTNVIPAVSTSIGGFAGYFSTGPINEVKLIGSEKELKEVFGAPSLTDSAEDYFQAASFLKYGNALKVVRADNASLKNAHSLHADTSVVALKVRNDDEYEIATASAYDTLGPYFARSAGTVGNSIKVVTINGLIFNGNTFDTAADNGNVGVGFLAPGSTTSATGAGNFAVQSAFKDNISGNEPLASDEVHIIVIDSDGGISGTANTILETFEYVSTTEGAKQVNGTSNYVKDVIFENSEYIFVGDAAAITTYATDDDLAKDTDDDAFNTDRYTVSTNATNQIHTVDIENQLGDGANYANFTTAGDITAALEYLSDSETEDVNLLFASGDSTGDDTIAKKVIEIAEARKDCVGFVSPVINDSTGTDPLTDVKAFYAGIPSSSYGVGDSTAIKVYDKYNDRYILIPASGYTAGLCANTDNVAEPWFSPAGFNRGQLQSVTKLAYNPKKADRDELYKSRINPIVSFPGQGTVLFGDKTLQAKPSAFDRINVRRLFIVLEKAISTAAKFQLFELNDEFTRAMFRNMVEPFLRDVKGRRGITDFLVICDETNNTGQVIDSNRFVADIYIKPARSINFISLNFIATRTGVEFSEIVGK